jgi:uncharacterized membrane protein
MLNHLLESWSSLYSNHATLRTIIGFVHVGGLMAGGGCAIATDLATIIAARQKTAAESALLQLLKRTHVIVLAGLIALGVSGVLLFAADVETYIASRVFWLKMGLLTVLVINGVRLLVDERRATNGEMRAWSRFHYTAVTSLVLWFLTTLAGAALPNVG